MFLKITEVFEFTKNLLFYLMNEVKKITSVRELIDYYQQTKQKIFVIGRIYSNTPLVIANFIPGFQMVTCYDPFDGVFPFIKVPDHLKRDHKCIDPFQCQLSILRNPETIAYLKSKSQKPKIQYMMIDEENEKISEQNNLVLWCGPCKAFNQLGNKINILEMIQKIGGIPFIPNVCSKINSYQHLLQLSQAFNTDKLVVQSQVGCSGMGTYFIFSEEDYDNYAQQLQDPYVKKIMPFKRLKSFGISAVAGKFGTVIGPLHAEVIGHKKLTPYRGGFCANEMRSDYFQNQSIERRVRREIFQITKKLGDYLYKQNMFRGIFGVDFVVDYDSFEVYFMEINPRLTGSTTISFQTYQAQGIQFPLALFHFAQYMNLQLQLPIQSFNRSWEEMNFYSTATHIAIKPFTEEQRNIDYTGFPPGLWRKGQNGYEPTGKFTLKLSEMSEEDILFIPNRGFSKGNIIMKKKCQQFSGQLTSEAQEIIDFFLSKIQKYKK